MNKTDHENFDYLHKINVTVTYRYKGGASNTVSSAKQGFYLNLKKGDRIGSTAKITFQFTDEDPRFDFNGYITMIQDALDFRRKRAKTYVDDILTRDGENG